VETPSRQWLTHLEARAVYEKYRTSGSAVCGRWVIEIPLIRNTPGLSHNHPTDEEEAMQRRELGEHTTLPRAIPGGCGMSGLPPQAQTEPRASIWWATHDDRLAPPEECSLPPLTNVAPACSKS
jgi:hypothetical protein